MARREFPPDTVVLREVLAIKALAHPARLQLLDMLDDMQPLTATGAAEQIGLSTSAVSYHLRELARYGLVVETPGDDGRERRWKGVRGWAIDADEPRLAAAATSAVAGSALDRTQRDTAVYLAQADREPEDWRDIAMITTTNTWLTMEEARELFETVERFLKRTREDDRTPEDHPAAARRMRISFVMLPTDEPPEA